MSATSKRTELSSVPESPVEVAPPVEVAEVFAVLPLVVSLLPSVASMDGLRPVQPHRVALASANMMVAVVRCGVAPSKPRDPRLGGMREARICGFAAVRIRRYPWCAWWQAYFRRCTCVKSKMGDLGSRVFSREMKPRFGRSTPVCRCPGICRGTPNRQRLG